jgi:small subunit ribosomal protein S21
MVKVSKHNGESDENFIKRFKRAVEKSGLMNELRKREYYDPQADRKKREQNAREKAQAAKDLRQKLNSKNKT